MTKAIDFYFDFASPYGYLASFRIDAIADRHGRTVNWRPFMLGAAFRETGLTPLVHQPMRGPYALRDIQREARRRNRPFTIPDPFPFVALGPSRAFYWLDDKDPKLAQAFARRVYDAAFAEGKPQSKPQDCVDHAVALGVDAQEFLAAAAAPQWKQKLKDVTEEALRRGVFGSPFFFVDDEPFWGNDRLEVLEEWLTRGGW